MEKHLYSIFDRVAAEYGPIFEAVNDGVAMRNFNQSVEKAPAKDDYFLVRLGLRNSITGAIETVQQWDVPGDVSFNRDAVVKLGVTLGEDNAEKL